MRNQFQSSGFTLIELMLVVLIIGILAAIGYPNYQEQVRKGQRADAKNSILLFSAQQQRYYSDHGYYASINQLTQSQTATSQEAHYEITISCTPECTASARPQRFIITATPNFTDSLCGTYQYNQTGLVTNSGSAKDNYCW